MQYFYTEADGSLTEVQEERWFWIAVYKDGTFLSQFGDDGVFHRVGEIDQDELERVFLVESETARCIVINWVDGMRLIHKYRNVVLNVGTEDERHIRIYIFGWKLGENYQYHFILPNGNIFTSPTDNVPTTSFNL